MNETIMSLRADLHTQKTNSSTFVDFVPRAFLIGLLSSTSIERKKIANLDDTIQRLRNQLATLQCMSNREKDALNEAIKVKEESSSVSITTLTRLS